MASKDAMITAADLLRAGKEVHNRALHETGALLHELEPALAAWVENWADKSAGRLVSNGARVEDAQYVGAEMRRMGYGVIRAMQNGNYRLWANIFEESPRSESEKGHGKVEG